MVIKGQKLPEILPVNPHVLGGAAPITHADPHVDLSHVEIPRQMRIDHKSHRRWNGEAKDDDE